MIRHHVIYYLLCVVFGLGLLFGRATAPEHMVTDTQSDCGMVP